MLNNEDNIANCLRNSLEKGQYGLIRTWDITEEVKTLKEAQSYKSMIDNSVSKAQIVDTVTMKVVEQWV